jgi:hypothetical protein
MVLAVINGHKPDGKQYQADQTGEQRWAGCKNLLNSAIS